MATPIQPKCSTSVFREISYRRFWFARICSTIAFAYSRSTILSMMPLCVLGCANVVSVVVRSSLVQLEPPDDMRGCVSAVNSLFIGTSNQLGEFESLSSGYKWFYFPKFTTT